MKLVHLWFQLLSFQNVIGDRWQPVKTTTTKKLRKQKEKKRVEPNKNLIPMWPPFILEMTHVSHQPTLPVTSCSYLYMRDISSYSMYLLCDDKVDINISMYKISISASPNSSFYPHQAMFFGVLEYCIWFQIFRVSRVGFIRFDPTDVLAATEAPFLQALKKEK